MTTVEALKSLYAALGGSGADVADCQTNVDVLNAIAAKYEGDADALQNAIAVANIAAVADNIGGGGGGGDLSTAQVTVNNTSSNTTGAIFVASVLDDGADAYTLAERHPGGASVTYTVLLYKGMAYCDLTDFSHQAIIATGGVDYSSEDNDALITGDGVINIANPADH